jgi:thiol-disulfide isomerase/thioredoxin
MSLINRRTVLTYLGWGGLGLAGAAMANSTHSSATNSQVQPSAEIPDSLVAAASPLPELQGIETWLNSEPLKLSEQRGKVILVQFWTFACINCQRTLPSIVQWHQKYAQQGLLVVGVHTPELAFERNLGNVKKAIQQRGITYPVAIDNNYQSWNAYDNHYWPHLYLADRQGKIRYDHIGEGAYPETEQKIRELLRH